MNNLILSISKYLTLGFTSVVDVYVKTLRLLQIEIQVRLTPPKLINASSSNFKKMLLLAPTGLNMHLAISPSV